jgi:hypothetical protein
MSQATAAVAAGARGAATAANPKPLLDIVTPTPSDIVIAQSIKPKHISQIAEVKLGLQPEEYELHGPSMAKVRRGIAIRHMRMRG